MSMDISRVAVEVLTENGVKHAVAEALLQKMRWETGQVLSLIESLLALSAAFHEERRGRLGIMAGRLETVTACMVALQEEYREG